MEAVSHFTPSRMLIFGWYKNKQCTQTSVLQIFEAFWILTAFSFSRSVKDAVLDYTDSMAWLIDTHTLEQGLSAFSYRSTSDGAEGWGVGGGWGRGAKRLMSDVWYLLVHTLTLLGEEFKLSLLCGLPTSACFASRMMFNTKPAAPWRCGLCSGWSGRTLKSHELNPTEHRWHELELLDIPTLAPDPFTVN